MSAMIALRVWRNQLSAFDEAIESGKNEIADNGKTDREKANVAFDLHGLVRLSNEIPNVLKMLWGSTLELIDARVLENYDETGRELLETISKALQILDGLEGLLHAFEQTGGSVKGRDLLRTNIDQVLRLETQIKQNWPSFTEQDASDALEEHKRGETLETAEAFAQIARMDKQAWQEHVEKRKCMKQA